MLQHLPRYQLVPEAPFGGPDVQNQIHGHLKTTKGWADGEESRGDPHRNLAENPVNWGQDQ